MLTSNQKAICSFTMITVDLMIIKTLTNKKEEGYSSFSSFFKIRRTPTITIHASIKTRSMMVII